MDVNVNMDAADPRDQIIAEISPRVETISTRLPEFNGKNNPEIWISKIKTALHSQSYLEDQWALAAAECMKDKAESWWFQLIREEGASNIPWSQFKEKLLNQ
ncbi:hypothetical protein PtB15_8B205 [Puccinia triticina]|nr:hypothetical protein PtB15_8B205 [Puccinia triticina]